MTAALRRAVAVCATACAAQLALACAAGPQPPRPAAPARADAPPPDAPAWRAPAPWAGDRVRVLVRGDDFGYTHASNVGMARSLAAGVVRSASVMVVGPWFAETAALARAHPEWTVGLHLTLTSEWDRLRWGPALPADARSGLLAPDGAFFHNYLRPAVHVADPRAVTGFVAERLPSPAAAEAELRAQIDRARRLGVRVEYLDCHMWTVCQPALRHVLVKLAAELCVPVPELGWMGERDLRLDTHERADSTGGRLAAALDSLRPGLYRLVTHPAEDSPELRAVDTRAGEREARHRGALLEALTSPDLRRLVEARRIELVSVRDLWDSGRCALR